MEKETNIYVSLLFIYTIADIAEANSNFGI